MFSFIFRVFQVGDPAKYEAKLRDRFPLIPGITVSKKADSLFPVVSAASIVAKVCRDQALREWCFLEGARFHADRQIKYGSGYPSDPVTKKFLLDHCDAVFGYPQLIRFSWSTATNAMAASAVTVQWETVLTEEEAEAAAGSQPITNFFRKRAREVDRDVVAVSSLNRSQVGRHRFFSERNIVSAKCL